MIRVENVWKRFPDGRGGHSPWVLRDINLEIPDKTNVAILGRNGAGKSTLLRIIGGGDRPSRGKVTLDTRVSWPVGFAGGLQGKLTGRQNTMFVIRIMGREKDKDEIIKRIEDFAEIGPAFDRPVKTYSSGMRSRLKFAMSLAFDFDIYISDEVTAVGDATFKEKAKDHFRSLVGKAGLIMVSHSMTDIRDFCDAGVVLENGDAHWFDWAGDAVRYYKESIGQKVPEWAMKR
ncbi:ABC transporter ATP-binding protein [Sphingomicrobium aestuariivivum]|uniref:ABC transporter ATP-binding protein n=1 Tax=Sphingomicrobium aestuariivivum TaxID=1582356 RepID=UPI001FD6AED6|nr:ABC transporter ATP-binding protein [Sphingomicrobium aestuariivivum]MCJ8191585.1 ABC transporter ATP-binding protein [Sphingomicrobium aestuariivivum]